MYLIGKFTTMTWNRKQVPKYAKEVNALKKRKKILACAVLATVLSTGVVYAAPKSTVYTVKESNTADSPYKSITINASGSAATYACPTTDPTTLPS